jgi:hypothetical protein
MKAYGTWVLQEGQNPKTGKLSRYPKLETLSLEKPQTVTIPLPGTK